MDVLSQASTRRLLADCYLWVAFLFHRKPRPTKSRRAQLGYQNLVWTSTVGLRSTLFKTAASVEAGGRTELPLDPRSTSNTGPIPEGHWFTYFGVQLLDRGNLNCMWPAVKIEMMVFFWVP